MNPAVFFAVLAALSFGFWTIFHKLAAPHINQVFGAILVSLTAVILGVVFFFGKMKGQELVTNPKGWLFIILAGVTAFFIDYFALSAYSRGLPLSLGGPIIIGGSMAVAALVGFAFGETVTFIKIFSIALIFIGGVILSMQSQ